MINGKKFSIFILCIALAIILISGSTLADDYPNRPITLIVPFSPGGGSDVMARTTMPFVEEELGVSIVIENVEGAGSQVGLQQALRADADGYTFMQLNQVNTSMSILLQDAPYEVEDFAVLNMQHHDPVQVIVMEDSPHENMVDLIEYIKQNPGEVGFGVTGTSAGHILAENLRSELDLDYSIVTYPGGGEGRADLAGGHVDVYIANVASNIPLRDQARSLGHGGDEEAAEWPESKTFDEQLLDKYGYEAPRLPQLRGFAFPAEFKENYPERFNKFLEAYERAYFNEEHLLAHEETGQKPIMTWLGHEESQKAFENYHETVEPFKDMLAE